MAFLTWPSDIPFGNVKITSDQPTYQSVTHSRKQLTRSRQIQQYLISFDIVLNEEQERRLSAFLMKLNGRLTPFYFEIPRRSSSQNNIYGSVQIAQDLAAGQNSIPVQGFSGRIKAGDYIQIQNDPKMYMAVDDCIAGESLNIVPSLRKPVLTSDVIETQDLKFLVSLTKDKTDIQSPFYGAHKLKLSVQEYLT